MIAAVIVHDSPPHKRRHDSILLQIFKTVREARNKSRAKFKLNQKKAQTKKCSKRVTVNGDIFHQMASEREIPNATLEIIPEEQTPPVSSVQHPQDKSYKMFFSKRTKPRKKTVLYVPAVKLPQGPFELSDDWQLQFDLPQQDRDAKQECNTENRSRHTSRQQAEDQKEVCGQTSWRW